MVRSYLGKPGMVLVKALVAMIVFVAASWFIGVYLEQQFDALWASLACAIGIYLLVLVRRLHFAQRIRPQELGKNPPSSTDPRGEVCAEGSTLAGGEVQEHHSGEEIGRLSTYIRGALFCPPQINISGLLSKGKLMLWCSCCRVFRPPTPMSGW